MPSTISSPQTSLTRKTLIKMGLRIAIVIILTTLVSYWHVVSVLKSQALAQLEKYIIERGQRESAIFTLAQDNHIVLKKAFFNQLEKLGNQDPQSQFDQIFTQWSDGTTRNSPKDQPPDNFNTNLYPSVYIGTQVNIDAAIRRQVLTFYQLLSSYGPAWSNRFVDTYFLSPKNIVVNYWPGEPWALTATTDLNILNEEYFYVSDKQHNPTRQPAWTGLYFDNVVKLWMVSLETPVDDEQGRHIATIGHDIILNELMERTIHDTLAGTYNIILRADGRLIADPNKMAAIQEKGGQFDILKSNDQHLIHIFDLVKNSQASQVIIENTLENEYLAVTKIAGPEWYFVTVYPKYLLEQPAFATARLILLLGVISLLIEILLLFLVLRNQIMKPLCEFIATTQRITTGGFNIRTETDAAGHSMQKALLIERSDELGQLAKSFHDMVAQLKMSFDALETKNMVFKKVIEDIVLVSQKLAVGNLQVILQADYQGDLVKIKIALETALANLGLVITDIVQVSQGLAASNLKVMPTAEYQGDFAEIKNALETAAAKLAETTAKNDVQNWIKNGQARLNELMSGEQEIEGLAKKIISFLCNYAGAQVGLFYLLKEANDQQAYLQIVASYAYVTDGNRPNKYLVGEGLVGEVALEQKTILFTQSNEECPAIIRSGLANTIPCYLLLIPFRYENSLKGVIEMGFSTELSAIRRDFLEQVMPNIGIAINAADSRTKMQVLLEQSQHQAEELQSKQAALQKNNEELQNQSEELQTQQEELRQTNEELETHSRDLKQQKEAIRDKNLALEKSQNEMEKARTAIETKARELEQANKYKSEFLANMSHELRTPLNSLLILAQLLADNKQGNLTSKQVEYAQTMHSSGSELLVIINEILDLSKVEAGKLEVQIEEISLPELMMAIEQKFRPVTENKNLAFHLVIAEDVPVAYQTDEQRLKQIINNLLSNAIKFTNEGEIKVTVQILATTQMGAEKLHETNKAIVIAVSDTGIGIPPDKQEIVFEAFQQADGTTSRSYGGTGLGLSISRQLAQLLGGKLTLASEKGQGTTFSLYLPINNSKSSKAQISANNSVAQSNIIRSSPTVAEIGPVSTDSSKISQSIVDDRNNLSAGAKFILVIEDDRKFSTILMELAREKKFKCLLAENGLTGLQLAEKYKPDAIILDIGLPQLDGFEVMKKLKDSPEIRHIPVHFISAAEQSINAKKMGAIGYAIKPVSIKQLGKIFQTIEQFLTKTVKELLLIADDELHKQKILELIGSEDIQINNVLTNEITSQYLQTINVDCVILDMDREHDSAGSKLLKLMRQKQLEKKSCRLCQTPVIVYAERNLTSEEQAILLRCENEHLIKAVHSPERLLDKATLFLHQLEAKLPADKRSMLHVVHEKIAIFKYKRVLIVDDDIRNTYALAIVLEEYDMEIVTATNGKKGLSVLKANPDIAIVLMDIMMPEMDGYATIQAIRDQVQYRDLPIIALTAKAMKDDRAKCIEAGANDYLSKPVDTDKLLSLMRVWLYQ